MGILVLKDGLTNMQHVDAICISKINNLGREPMKKHIFPKSITLATLIGCVALFAGCASTTPTVDTSDKAGMSHDGLFPVKGGTADQAWARFDVDISQYSKIKLQGAGIEYRPGGESGRLYHSRTSGDHFELSDKQKERLRAILTEAFEVELNKSEHFTIVDEAAPDVLLIYGGVLDVVSYVPPEPIGRSEIYLSSVGEATLVLEIRDSVSEAILVRVVDRRAAEDISGFSRSNSVSNTSDVRRLANSWARKLRERLDTYAAQ